MIAEQRGATIVCEPGSYKVVMPNLPQPHGARVDDEPEIGAWIRRADHRGRQVRVECQISRAGRFSNLASSSIFTASKLMAPRRSASATACST